MKNRSLKVKCLVALAVCSLLFGLGWLAVPQPVEAQGDCSYLEWEGFWSPFGPNGEGRCASGRHLDCSGAIVICRPLY